MAVMLWPCTLSPVRKRHRTRFVESAAQTPRLFFPVIPFPATAATNTGPEAGPSGKAKETKRLHWAVEGAPAASGAKEPVRANSEGASAAPQYKAEFVLAEASLPADERRRAGRRRLRDAGDVDVVRGDGLAGVVGQSSRAGGTCRDRQRGKSALRRSKSRFRPVTDGHIETERADVAGSVRRRDGHGRHAHRQRGACGRVLRDEHNAVGIRGRGLRNVVGQRRRAALPGRQGERSKAPGNDRRGGVHHFDHAN
jgi:hypothetical protein